jgi:2-polyprenyl-3-methyl-5-hydroxy-6-metoxy-1,4-benzoquinol methylase
MIPDNAIEWHSQIANDFDLNYKYSKRFIERYEIWTKIIAKYSNPDKLVLDIGCGSGIFSFFSLERNAKVVGVDASSKMIDICESKKAQANYNNIYFINCDIISLSQLFSEQVDIIICSSVLEYLTNVSYTLEIILSLLKPNGLFIFSMPNGSSLYRKIESIIFKLIKRPRYCKYVKNIITLKKMTEKLSNYKFTILESAYYSATPLLSKLFRSMGLSKYSDNLFIIVVRRSG